MSYWSNIFYFSIISAALVLSVMGLLFTAAMPGIDRWSKRFFRSYFIVLMVCCFSGFTDLILSYYPVPRAAVYFILVFECLFLSLPLPMLTVYLLHCFGEAARESRLLRRKHTPGQAYLHRAWPVGGLFCPAYKRHVYRRFLLCRAGKLL